MKAIVDKSGCISCGICVDLCPSVFRFADDGLAEVYTEVTNDNLSQAKSAADDCPTDVITIKD